MIPSMPDYSLGPDEDEGDGWVVCRGIFAAAKMRHPSVVVRSDVGYPPHPSLL